MTDAYFVPRGEAFEATPLTRGPWEEGLQHAGPACALLARAVESHAPGHHVARLTYDLARALPVGGLFAVHVEPGRTGRKVTTADAVLTCDGREMVRARALLMRREDVAVPPPLEPIDRVAPPDACEPWEFPFFRWDVGYHRTMEIRRIFGTFGRGHMAVWFRLRSAVVEGEAPTPLQRLCAAADSGNGVSVFLDLAHYTFVNPDLTVVLLRPPVGEWFALHARTLAGPAGAGMADTRLHDVDGVVGRSVQTLLVESRARRAPG